VRTKTSHTLATFDLDYLRLLAETIDADPPQEKDAVMLAMLPNIGTIRNHIATLAGYRLFVRHLSRMKHAVAAEIDFESVELTSSAPL